MKSAPRSEVDLTAAAAALVDAGKELHGKGWVPATSGNLSVRVGAEVIAITASGRDKGKLTAADVLAVDLDGRPLSAGLVPSAETLLHTAVYRRYPNAGAVVHVHSVNATVLSRVRRGRVLELAGWELLKAFSGITTHEITLPVPILDNHQDMDVLAPALERALEAHEPAGPLHGFLLRGHGLYAWGGNLTHACRHAEAFDFLFSCELALERFHS